MHSGYIAMILIDERGYEALARCFLPDIIAFFQSEDGQREFEAWKRRKAGKGEQHEPDDTDKA